MTDSHQAYARALELGAQPIEIPTGPMELRLPAIKGIGGAPLYLIGTRPAAPRRDFGRNLKAGARYKRIG